MKVVYLLNGNTVVEFSIPVFFFYSRVDAKAPFSNRPGPIPCSPVMKRKLNGMITESSSGTLTLRLSNRV